jgi:toxin ParE1/3/4
MNAEDRWKVIYSSDADRDFAEIHSYIADVLLEPAIADKQIARIKKAADSLDFMPYRCRLYDREPWRSRGVRVLLVDNYVVLYIPIESIRRVDILHVIHSLRNIDRVIDETEDSNP